MPDPFDDLESLQKPKVGKDPFDDYMAANAQKAAASRDAALRQQAEAKATRYANALEDFTSGGPIQAAVDYVTPSLSPAYKGLKRNAAAGLASLGTEAVSFASRGVAIANPFPNASLNDTAADQLNRHIAALETGAELADTGRMPTGNWSDKTVPEVAGKVVRGAAREIPKMLAGGAAARAIGGVGAVAQAGVSGAGYGALQANQGLTEARDAGLSEGATAAHVAGSAAIGMSEGFLSLLAPTAVAKAAKWANTPAGKIIEDATQQGFAAALKSAGKTAASEGAEEMFQSTLEVVLGMADGVNPDVTLDQFAGIMVDSGVIGGAIGGGMHSPETGAAALKAVKEKWGMPTGPVQAPPQEQPAVNRGRSHEPVAPQPPPAFTLGNFTPYQNPQNEPVRGASNSPTPELAPAVQQAAANAPDGSLDLVDHADLVIYAGAGNQEAKAELQRREQEAQNAAYSGFSKGRAPVDTTRPAGDVQINRRSLGEVASQNTYNPAETVTDAVPPKETVIPAEANPSEIPNGSTPPEAGPLEPPIPAKGAATEAPPRPASTTPAASKVGNAPDWLNNNIDHFTYEADRNGVADKIEELSAQGVLAKAVVQRIWPNSVGTEFQDRLSVVRAVKAKRGIPSSDDPEFKTWLAQRRTAPPAASIDWYEETPEVAPETPSKGMAPEAAKTKVFAGTGKNRVEANARYESVPVESLAPSHIPGGFGDALPNQAFQGVQPRELDKAGRTIRFENFKKGLRADNISDIQDSAFGPPVAIKIGNKYHFVAGNGRAFGALMLHGKGNESQRAEYENVLAQKAAQFGVSPKPGEVLIRVLDGKTKREAIEAIGKLSNEAQIQTEDAAHTWTRLPEDFRKRLASEMSAIDEDPERNSLEWLRDSDGAAAGNLRRDIAFGLGNSAPQYLDNVDGQWKFTKAGLELIRKGLLSDTFGPDYVQSLGEKTSEDLLASIKPLKALTEKSPTFIQDFKDALDVARRTLIGGRSDSKYKRNYETVARYRADQMYGLDVNPTVEMIADGIMKNGLLKDGSAISRSGLRATLEKIRQQFADDGLLGGAIDEVPGNEAVGKALGIKPIKGAFENYANETKPTLKRGLAPKSTTPPKPLNKGVIAPKVDAEGSYDSKGKLKTPKPNTEGMNERETALLGHLSNEPVSVEDLIKATGKPQHEVLATLLVLEVRRLAKQLPGRQFVLNDAPAKNPEPNIGLAAKPEPAPENTPEEVRDARMKIIDKAKATLKALPEADKKKLKAGDMLILTGQIPLQISDIKADGKGRREYHVQHMLPDNDGKFATKVLPFNQKDIQSMTPKEWTEIKAQSDEVVRLRAKETELKDAQRKEEFARLEKEHAERTIKSELSDESVRPSYDLMEGKRKPDERLAVAEKSLRESEAIYQPKLADYKAGKIDNIEFSKAVQERRQNLEYFDRRAYDVDNQDRIEAAKAREARLAELDAEHHKEKVEAQRKKMDAEYEASKPKAAPAKGMAADRPPHIAVYNGKEVPITETDPKKAFREAASRVSVNIGEGDTGYVITPDKKVYRIDSGYKSGRLVTGMTPDELLAVHKDGYQAKLRNGIYNELKRGPKTANDLNFAINKGAYDANVSDSPFQQAIKWLTDRGAIEKNEKSGKYKIVPKDAVPENPEAWLKQYEPGTPEAKLAVDLIHGDPYTIKNGLGINSYTPEQAETMVARALKDGQIDQAKADQQRAKIEEYRKLPKKAVAAPEVTDVEDDADEQVDPFEVAHDQWVQDRTDGVNALKAKGLTKLEATKQWEKLHPEPKRESAVAQEDDDDSLDDFHVPASPHAQAVEFYESAKRIAVRNSVSKGMSQSEAEAQFVRENGDAPKEDTASDKARDAWVKSQPIHGDAYAAVVMNPDNIADYMREQRIKPEELMASLNAAKRDGIQIEREPERRKLLQDMIDRKAEAKAVAERAKREADARDAEREAKKKHDDAKALGVRKLIDGGMNFHEATKKWEAENPAPLSATEQAKREADANVDPNITQMGSMGGVPFSTPPRPPVTSTTQYPPSSFPEQDKAMLAARGLKPVDQMPWYTDFYNRATQRYIHLDPNKVPLAGKADNKTIRNWFLFFENIPNIVSSQSSENVAAMIDKLDAKSLPLFEKIVVLRNLLQAGYRGEPLRFEYKKLRDVYDALQEAETEAAKTPAIGDALKTHDAVMKEMTEKLVEVDSLDKEALERQDYFHQMVLAYAEAQKGNPNSIYRSPTIATKSSQKARSSVYNGEILEKAAEIAESKDPGEKDRLKNEMLDLHTENAGPDMDYNTDTIQSTVAFMRQSIETYEKWKHYEKLNKMAGIPVESLRKQANAENKANILGRIRGDERMEATWNGFNKRLGMLAKKLNLKGLNANMQAIDPPGNVLEELARIAKDTSNPLFIPARAFFKAISERRAWVKKTLAREWKEWKDLVPQGYKTHQPQPGNIFYRAGVVKEQMYEQMMAEAQKAFTVTGNDLRDAIVMGGPKEEFVLPEDVVNQLDEISKPKDYGGTWKQLGQQLVNTIKAGMLFAPNKVAGYFLRNQVSDTLVQVLMPGGKETLANSPRAFAELLDHLRTDRPSLSKSPKYAAAERWGVINSTHGAQEIADLYDNPLFKRFRNQEGKSLWQTEDKLKLGADLIRALGATTVRTNTIREGVMRYASFLMFLDYVKKGGKGLDAGPGYGASDPDEIKGILKHFGPEAAAAKLARDQNGDYVNIPKWAESLRRGWMPFISWPVVNFKRQAGLLMNAFHDRGKSKGLTPVKAGFSIAKLASVAIAAWTFNHAMFPAQEAALPPHEQATVHLIVGTNEDGSAKLFKGFDPFTDNLENFGLSEGIRGAESMMRGQTTAGQVAKDMAKAPVNTGVNLVGWPKSLLEAGMGKSLYPDVFNPRPQPAEAALTGMFGQQDLGRAVHGAIWKDGERAKNDIFHVTSRVDPRDGVAAQMYDLKTKFMRKQGYADRSATEVSSVKLLKDAAKRGDQQAFNEARAVYLDQPGKSGQTYTMALSHLNPITSVKTSLRPAFIKFLTPDQREQLKAAQAYAAELRGTMWKMWVQAGKDAKKAVK